MTKHSFQQLGRAVLQTEAEAITALIERMRGSEEFKFMSDYHNAKAELQIRDRSFLAKVGSGASELPAYMIEFLATGGLFTAGVYMLVAIGTGAAPGRFILWRHNCQMVSPQALSWLKKGSLWMR